MGSAPKLVDVRNVVPSESTELMLLTDTCGSGISPAVGFDRRGLRTVAY